MLLEVLEDIDHLQDGHCYPNQLQRIRDLVVSKYQNFRAIFILKFVRITYGSHEDHTYIYNGI